ncbi:MAG: cytochrome c family protein [Pirellulales bacterium]|nr:cytochrome c family protein [Pirellulales bacterium]
MRLTPRLLERRTLTYYVIVTTTLCGIGLSSRQSSTAAIHPVPQARAQSQNLAGQLVDPAKVIGRETCRTCHDQEHAAWQASSHGSKAWQRLTHAKAADFATALGIPVDKITSAESVCTQCHGTPIVENGALSVAPGNSCESCHGEAGGEGGWFKIHADYGRGMDFTMTELLNQRNAESAEHRAARLAACRNAGMKRADDVLAVAKNCLTCHIVPIEELIAAGHPTSSGFEIVRWSQGEVRHNVLLDRGKNAETPSLWLAGSENRTAEGRDRLMFLAGKLADLELSLRVRASITSTDRRSLGREVCDRIEDALGALAETQLADLAPVMEVANNFQFTRDSLRALTADDKRKYSLAAALVAEEANKFIARHADGNRLPDSVRISPRVMGKVFDPGK